MKKWILIILVALGGLILVVAGGGYLWFHQTLKRSLPQTSGEVVLSGLNEGVEIIRDTYGVPHIYAKNEPDLYFALGYAMAQDRFWQMEFHRRLGNGRLSEVFGKDFIKADRYFRVLTGAGLRKDVPNDLAFLPRAFADGVNAYLETHRERLPFEFKLLGYRPEPWDVDDYLAILKVVNWGLSSGWRVDLTAAEMLEKVGEQKLREAFPVWPDDGPLIVSEQGKLLSILSDPTVKTLRLAKRLATISALAASNNWVVSGKKSVTGKPILANDTHLGLTNPSVWWEVHMVCPTMDVSGFAIPGVPGIAIGHNRHVTWGVTNVMVDDVDFYIEKINPENPRQYRYKDHWEDMEVIVETIRVKGQDPVKTEILLTRHGPIVNEVKKDSKENAISARWAFTEGLQPGQAAYSLAKAENIQGVKEALRYWELPSQNFVFADVNGNIGYWCCATIPIRSKGDGILPVPGWTGEYEWKGYVPFDERPHLMNPEEGFITTANNKVAGKDYPYLISHYWEPMDRITRIHQLLRAKEKLSIDDFKRMHQDFYCLLASEVTPRMIQVLERRFLDQEAKKAKDILSKWDFIMGKESVAACLFEVTYRKMMDNIFKDELGEELLQAYLKTASLPPRALRMMVRKGSSPWFDDVNTPESETMEDIIAKSLSQMLVELKEVIGGDMDEWTWGKIHTLTFEHVLGKRKPLDRIFNLGPFPVGGSSLTVNKRQYPYENPYHANHGVSQRMIVDLSDVDGSLHVLPTGESGHLRSPHYKDQTGLYLDGGYHLAWTERRDVEKHREGTLILKPRLD
ncbi:MAG: penicillin acylase family protein [Deltaproteobacteria bacterium]|nr:MAG: penicillin acylase family protein [Deltaproteobacteria bacterium]